ncbi:MAG: hypothetical protein ACKV2V_27245, partial [Blastocatellia bacterium]
MKRVDIARQLAEGAWYAEGAAADIAAAVLRQPSLFDELCECLLSPDIGTARRAAMALETISRRQPGWFTPYVDVLLEELATRPSWFIRFRLCPIVARVRLDRGQHARAVALCRELADHAQNALAV